MEDGGTYIEINSMIGSEEGGEMERKGGER